MQKGKKFLEAIVTVLFIDGIHSSDYQNEIIPLKFYNLNAPIDRSLSAYQG